MEKKVAPDGGYGWIIVLGNAFTNIILIPILQNFGLLFRKVFKELNFSTTDISTIINVNAAFGMLLGLLNGPLLKKFGYRKTAFTGSIMTFVGLLLTSRASSLAEFILFYGLLPSYGFVLLLSSLSIAQNTYFRERRSFAAGISMTIIGIGPIIMPHVISKLLAIYDVRGTALIIAALSLHSMVGASLLQPIKWHYKKIPPDIEGANEETRALKDHTTSENGKIESNLIPELTIDPYQSVHDLESTIQPRRFSESISVRGLQSQTSLADSLGEIIEPDATWWKPNLNPIHASAPNILTTTENGKLRQRLTSLKDESEPINENKKMKKKRGRTKIIQNIVTIFDLDLFKDPIYVNIWLGMSIAFTGEINFSLMTPIILGDRNFNIEETATIMSVIAFSDIVFRFISPFFGKLTKLPARKMYMFSLLLLIISRTWLTFAVTLKETLAVAGLLGVAKGFRTVYMTLVIPNHVPLEKLPSASSLQTVLNGVFLSVFGPLLGYLRDVTGNFNICIHVINSFTATTLVLWSIEIIILASKRRKEKNLDKNIDKVSTELVTKKN